MFLDESCDILTEKEKDLIPSHDQVNHLLSFIAIGELVASSDCKLFMNKFKNEEATCELRSRLELSLENHKNVIRKMPHIVFGEDSIIACKISKQFVQYYEINKARLFNEF